jgi:hypothetical protein
MEAVANNPSFAKKAGVPQSVGQEFAQADKGKSFGKGSESRADIQLINKPKTNHGDMAVMKKGGVMKKMASGGMTTGKQPSKEKSGITMEKMAKVKTAAPSRDGLATKGKTRGMEPKMSASKPLGMKKGGKAK